LGLPASQIALMIDAQRMTRDERGMTNNQDLNRRFRLTFAKAEALKYISHLDLARAWERVFRRAGLPVAYSKGFNPRPRFQIAAALPVGVMGWAEYLDVWLTVPMTCEDVLSRLQPALPPGLKVMDIEEVELRAPALQSQVREADYRAVVQSREPLEAVRTRVESLLHASTILRKRHHKGRLRTYDLRPLIGYVTVESGQDGELVLSMRLQASPSGAGRPDAVLEVLGLSLVPHTVERTKLYFEFDK
jgi:radical SAM-linked protein